MSLKFSSICNRCLLFSLLFPNAMNILKKWSRWYWWMSLWIGLVSSSWHHLVCSFISHPSCKLVVKFRGYGIQIKKKKSRVFYRSCCVLLIASHQEHIPQIVSLLMMLTLLSEFGCFHSELYFKISQQPLPNGFSAINDDWIVLLFLPH